MSAKFKGIQQVFQKRTFLDESTPRAFIEVTAIAKEKYLLIMKPAVHDCLFDDNVVQFKLKQSTTSYGFN